MESKEINCIRCQLDLINDDELNKSIQDAIAMIAEDDKTKPETFDERIMICENCNHQINGVCNYCGCFVQVRAAKINQRCPLPKRKW